MFFYLIFWLSFLFIIHHYFIFPLIIFILSINYKHRSSTSNDVPSVTIIIAAYNEEKVIKGKIINSLSLKYPKDKTDIIVVSDGSSDRTPAIAEEFHNRGVLPLHAKDRRGKSAAINRAMKHAKGDVILFTDANTRLSKDSLHKLVNHFSDKRVGGVSGRKAVIPNKNHDGVLSADSKFWNFESTLKSWEGRYGSIPTADGEIFAIRRSLFDPLPEKIINDDCAITLDIIRKGYRVIYEPKAISREYSSVSMKDEFGIKSRMVYGGYQIIKKYWNCRREFDTFFVFQYFSHKIIRHSMWFLLMAIFLSNAFIDGTLYNAFFYTQSAFYIISIIGLILTLSGKKIQFFYLPMYYCAVNIASAFGLAHFLLKTPTIKIWRKAER